MCFFDKNLFVLSAYEMKNNCSLFDRLFLKKNNVIFTTEFSMKEYCGQPDFTHMVGRLVGWLVGPSAVNILIREVRV